MTGARTNWAGNLNFSAADYAAPRSLDELRETVRGADKVRVAGSRHSFNTIADTPGTQISLEHFNGIREIDTDSRTVTIEGGATYGGIAPALQQAGFALHNLASLPDITVAGAVVTATHGSGNRNGNLATAVCGIEFVTADGELLTLRRGDKDFDGAVVNLGALGVMSAITLDLQPAFEVSQTIYAGLDFQALLDNFEAISASAYSVSAFTRWQGDTIDQVWLKRRSKEGAPPDTLFGAHKAPGPVHPIPTLDPEPATQQMGQPGPWHERLPHFRSGVTPSAGAELQSEYFVARTDAAPALAALKQIQHRIAPLLLTSEVRTMAADPLWLSLNYGRDSVAFHFTWQQDVPGVMAVLPYMEAALAPFEPRPHWAKLFTMPAGQVQSCYERLPDFRDLATRMDPSGKFRNAFVSDLLF